ncbi:MAG: 30S ribosomal protein S20 [Chloroflexi bacterium RBG_16_57_8]|nr:MAG: 30S ribosomal protein S20 [Chloroflexi bacterium RBG_16_57_8]
MRKTQSRTIVNKAVRSRAKTMITKAENLLAAGNVEAARQTIGSAASALDNAAGKGVIHPNNAARRKSRLMKKANKAAATAKKA